MWKSPSKTKVVVSISVFKQMRQVGKFEEQQYLSTLYIHVK